LAWKRITRPKATSVDPMFIEKLEEQEVME
jgi:hypothetical protein